MIHLQNSHSPITDRWHARPDWDSRDANAREGHTFMGAADAANAAKQMPESRPNYSI
jgi:hypothetical protein